MAVPTLISDLSPTLASNSPAGSDVIGTTMDDYIRAAYGFIAQQYAAVQPQTYTAFTTTSTKPAADRLYVLTPTPAIAANAADLLFWVTFDAAAAGVPTLAVSGKAALPLVYLDSKGTEQTVTATQCPAGWKGRVACNAGATKWVLRDTTGPSNEAQGANIASATTVDLGSATGNYVHITGTTAITAITLAQGAERTVVFDGALTLTNGASLILPGGANIATAAGDVAMFRGEAAGVVRCVEYQPAALPFVSYKVVSFTRDMSLASGTQAITGVGFKPRAVSFIAGHATGSANIASWGFDDGSAHVSSRWYNAENASAFAATASYSIAITPQTGAAYIGVVQSFDADGFTINWTKSVSPTGTVTVYALCYR